MPCLRGSQWAWQTIQSKTKSPPFFLVSDQCGCSSLRSLLTSTSSPSASVCSLSPVGFLPSSGRSGIHCSAQSPSRWPAYYWLRLLPTLIYNWTYSQHHLLLHICPDLPRGSGHRHPHIRDCEGEKTFLRRLWTIMGPSSRRWVFVSLFSPNVFSVWGGDTDSGSDRPTG